MHLFIIPSGFINVRFYHKLGTVIYIIIIIAVIQRRNIHSSVGSAGFSLAHSDVPTLAGECLHVYN